MKRVAILFVFISFAFSSFSQKGIIAIALKDSSQKVIKEGSYITVANGFDDKQRGVLKVVNDTTIQLKRFLKKNPDTVYVKNIYTIRKTGMAGLMFKGIILSSMIIVFIAVAQSGLGDFVAGQLIAIEALAGAGGFYIGNLLDEKYSMEKYYFKIQSTPGILK